MLVVDGSVAVPRDIDWLHMDVVAGGRIAHSGDYGLGAEGFSLPSTLAIVPGKGGQRDVKIRVVGRSGGATGLVRMLREAHTQIPDGRVAVLPMNLSTTCLDFVRDKHSGDTESSCGPGRTCVAGSCTTIDVTPSSLPTYVPGADYKEDDGAILVTPPQDATTSEAGKRATFRLRLGTKPSSEVRIPLSSARPAEGKLSVSEVVFTPDDWAVERSIEVEGVDDAVVDGDVAYAIVTGEATSLDRRYQWLDPPDIQLVNLDDDAAVPPPPPPPPPPDPDLVARYPLSGCDNHDAVGGATGTVSGSMSSSAGHDGTPGAACFLTSGSSIDLASPASATPHYSVSVWAKPDYANIGTYGSIVSRRDMFQSDIYGYNLFALPEGGTTLWIVYHAPMVMNPGNPWSTVAYSPATDALWHHVAFTYDGTDLVLYFDGAEQSRVATTYKYLPNNPVTIGMVGGAEGPVYPFAGDVEDVRIYDRALTAAEIATLAGR